MSTEVIRFAPDDWIMTDYLGMGAAAACFVLLVVIAVMAARKL